MDGSKISGGGSVRKRRRAVYLSEQDRGKGNPFAVSRGSETGFFSCSSLEVENSNDEWLLDNVPPHFGRL